MKKKKTNISHMSLNESFLKHKTQSGIIAKIIKFERLNINKTEKIESINKDKENLLKNKIEIEFLKLKEFQFWLDHKKKPFKGFLQKFIEPRAELNHQIKVCWTPQFAVLEKRTNYASLNRRNLEGRLSSFKEVNPEMEIYKRCVTYEGFEHLSTQESVLSVTLSSDIHRACNSISEHIKSSTNGCTKILRMNLYFKVDKYERLWLIMASDIQIQYINSEKNIITIHPLIMPKFEFTFPNFVINGNFTMEQLDEDVKSDYEDDFSVNELIKHDINN